MSKSASAHSALPSVALASQPQVENNEFLFPKVWAAMSGQWLPKSHKYPLTHSFSHSFSHSVNIYWIPLMCPLGETEKDSALVLKLFSNLKCTHMCVISAVIEISRRQHGTWGIGPYPGTLHWETNLNPAGWGVEICHALTDSTYYLLNAHNMPDSENLVLNAQPRSLLRSGQGVGETLLKKSFIHGFYCVSNMCQAGC